MRASSLSNTWPHLRVSPSSALATMRSRSRILRSRLGWHVTVADGRSNLVNVERFPHVNRLAVLK